MFYSEDKVQDMQYISRAYWRLYSKQVPTQNVNCSRKAVRKVVDDMYDKFPENNRENANPFKQAAWFAVCFLLHSPCETQFENKCTDVPEEQNAVIAYDIMFAALRKCKLNKDDQEYTICVSPDILMSRHSYGDMISVLAGWEKRQKELKDGGGWVEGEIKSFYEVLSLTIEQIAYRALPYLSYPPMSPLDPRQSS